jgi:Flp pilus assembly protein TadB
VQTLQNSLDRLQRFQRSARDVRDLIRFEDDIARRQSELQSLKAQQSYLADQAAMSTITLHLATTATHVAPRGALHDAGFLSGLEGGWRAFVGLVLVVLTVLGALVPFLLVGGLVGVPVWFALRRRRRRTTAPVTE